jgi:prolipoprotein diacylglyceryltransferase
MLPKGRLFRLDRKNRSNAVFCRSLSIIGARIYNVLFYLDSIALRRHPGLGAMLRIWDGGIAIYGRSSPDYTVIVKCE